MSNQAELLAIIEEVTGLLRTESTDFSTSSWLDAEHALKELRELAASIKESERPFRQLSTIFAPTGPLQEVAIRSGWGSQFLELADRLDDALAR